MINRYRKVEILLDRLLYSVSDVFSDDEVLEVSALVEHGEYGVALETFVSIVNEEDKAISDDVVDLIRESAIAMELDAVPIVAKLTQPSESEGG
jgi:hypothetical protein